MSEHSIQAAMERGELTEEEAFFILRFAGHLGYNKAIARLAPSRLRKLRQRLVWFGGWESTDLSVWDRGRPRWTFKGAPFPLKVLGLCIYSWGANLSLHSGYLCVTWSRAQGRKLYWSPNATPQHKDAVHFWGRK